MQVTMIGRFFDFGFDGISTYVDCWPCDGCGRVSPTGSCRDIDGTICEITAYCDECRDEGEYTFVRPDARHLFEFSSGERGWWSA